MSLNTSRSKRASRCTRKQPQLLAFHPEQKHPAHRLPFVGKEHTEDKSFSFWNVPVKGGYHGGTQTGKAIAAMFLKYLRKNKSDSDPGGVILGWMVTHWMERLTSGVIKNGSPEFQTLRGQMVGFMSEISPWVSAAACELGSNLDKTTDDTLLARANGGLDFDEEAYVQRIMSAVED